MNGHENTHHKIALGILGAVCAFHGAVAQAQAPTGTLPGTSYASLAELPDWSGWWLADAAATAQEKLASQPPPFSAQAARARSTSLAADSLPPMAYCRPREFTGQSGGFTEAMELLFTPGRVTLTTERGLLRRIYTDGRPMPEALEYTNTGTSIGHWEGDTLVVETAGIDPRVHYPDRSIGGIPIGENVVIHERIYLVDENTLRIDIETIAPDIFTMSDRRSQLYRRLSKTMANEISWCSEDDRSMDPTTGQERFDTTPPPGLPPPPSR
jgi:hypothetical protein